MKSKIKTIDDAFKARGLNPDDLPDVSKLPDRHKKAAISVYQLFIVAEALNAEANDGKEWIPDWNNSDEYKYYPYFDMQSKPGFGFSFTAYAYWCTHTSVGSRLCFKSRELAEYAGKQFADLYKEYMQITK